MEALSKSAKKFDELAAKEVQQDKVLPYARFSIKYEELKLKYGNWATSWPGRKTIARFVLEDIAIASFLICLWEDQQREENRFDLTSFWYDIMRMLIGYSNRRSVLTSSIGLLDSSK
jgi:hypothetical protein